MRVRRELHFGRVVPCLADRPPGVDALFRAAVAADPSAPAILFEGQRLSYGQLDERVGRCAAGLSARGLRRGERLATLIGNHPSFVELALACARMGLIQVPLNTRQRRPEIEYALNQSGAAALVHEVALAPEIPDADAVPSVRLRLAVDGDAAGGDTAGGDAAGSEPYECLLDDPAPRHQPSSPAEEDPLCILYTSGTTGRPKGAVLSNLGAVQSALNYVHGFGLVASDRVVLAVPASHVTGLVAIILAGLAARACLIVMPRFKARAFLELMEREAATVTLMVPAMYTLCLLDPEFDRFDLSSWRVGAFGGAPMPEGTARRMRERSPRLELLNVYGSTETTSPVTILPRDAGPERLDSVGTVLPTVDVRVMDEDGMEVPPGESGELWIAGSTVVRGYWENPEADATAFAGGYWRSGDVGSVDAEGFVRIHDRKKDMINRAGYKVYSAEVESVLSHHPAVAEVAVVGHADPVLGERVQAFVVPSGDATEDDMRGFCAARLSDYKVPDRITFMADGLPRNPNGKVLKDVLRGLCARPPDAP